MEQNNQNELYHYGVLGMKWGIRRAYNKGTTYNYRSHGQKKYQKKVNKLEAKLAKRDKKPTFNQQRKLDITKNKLETFKQRDKNRQEYVNSTSMGKQVVKGLLFGPLGTGNYNRFRAAGHGRIVSALGSNYVASTLGYPLTVLISRNSEFVTAKRTK